MTKNLNQDIERIEMMKIILIGLRQEAIINKNNKNFRQCLNDYVSCMRNARKFGILVKDIISYYNEINQIIGIKRKLGQLDSLVIKFNTDNRNLN